MSTMRADALAEHILRSAGYAGKIRWFHDGGAPSFWVSESINLTIWDPDDDGHEYVALHELGRDGDERILLKARHGLDRSVRGMIAILAEEIDPGTESDYFESSDIAATCGNLMVCEDDKIEDRLHKCSRAIRMLPDMMSLLESNLVWRRCERQ